MKKAILFIAVLCWSLSNVYSQRQLYEYQYWFDNGFASVSNQSISPQSSYQLLSSIGTSSLPVGLHVFHYRCRDNSGLWSTVVSRYFIKNPLGTTTNQKQITTNQYWFDSGFNNSVTLNVTDQNSITYIGILNTSALTIGLHVFHYRSRDNSGLWSTVVSNYFYKYSAGSTANQRQITTNQYWFDNDFSNKVTQNVMANESITFIVKLNSDSLSIGLHVFHYRSRDNSGLWSTVVSKYFIKNPTGTTASQKQIISNQYWFDSDFNNSITQNVTAQDTITFIGSLNTGTLSLGLHVFHYRSRDNSGLWSTVVSKYFIKNPANSTASQRQIITNQYWFDSDFGNSVTQNVTAQNNITFISNFNTDALSIGLHVFHYRSRDNSGLWSTVVSNYFIKNPAITTTTANQRQIITNQYWFDSDFNNNVTVTAQDNIIFISNLNTDALSIGLHVFHYRSRDNSGLWSTVVSQYFIKNPPITTTTANQRQIITNQYWFDSDFADNVIANVQGNLTFVGNLNTTNLSIGLHVFHYRSRDNSGLWSTVVSNYFIKNPSITTTTANQRQIITNQYWFDNSFYNRVNQNVTAQDTIIFISSINTDTLSYGQHVFHYRSRDNSGLWSTVYSKYFNKVKYTTVEYFVDNEPGFGNGIQVVVSSNTDSINLNINVNLTSATNGFHNLFVRAKDKQKHWSSTQNIPFYKVPAITTSATNITQLEYFIDNDPGFGKGTQLNTTLSNSISSNLIVSLQNTSLGFHTLFIRAKDDQNRWSTTQNVPFYVIPPSSTNITQLEYFIDTDPGFGKGTQLNTTSNSISSNLIVSLQNTTNGMHNLFVRAKDDQNNWSTTHNIPFYAIQATTTAGIKTKQLEYFFDTDPGYGNGTIVATASTGDLTTFTADLSSLVNSSHTLYTRAQDYLNRWSETIADTFHICVSPLKTTLPKGTTNLCINSSNTTYTTNKVSNATSYSWTISPSTAGTISWVDTLATVTWNSSFSGAAYVKAITHNSCDATPTDSLLITVTNIPSNAGTITGQQLAYLGQMGVTYSVAAIPNATSYFWTLPNGANGTSSTNSISVNYTFAATSGNITVKGYNNCGYGTSSSLAVTLSPLPADAGAITGAATVCQGQSSVVYTVPQIAGANSYTWTLPQGATGFSTTNSITLNFANNAVSDSIKVNGLNANGNGATSSLLINVNPLPSDAGTISGNPNGCTNQSGYIYSVPSINNATSYVWTLPDGASGTSTTNTINVSYNSIANTQGELLSVNGANACGYGNYSYKIINVYQTPSTPIVTVWDNCGSSVLSTTSMQSLHWSTGENTSYITVNNTNTYTVTASDNGCVSAPGSGYSHPKTIPNTPVVNVQNDCGYSVLSTTSSGSLLWSTGDTTSSITIVNTGTYTVSTTINGCQSSDGSGTASPITPVTQNINIVAGSNPSYQGYNVTYSANVNHPLSGQIYNWYVNNSLLQTSSANTFAYSPSNGDIVSCTLVSSGCYSGGNSNSITMIVNPDVLPSAAGLISGINPVCQGQNGVVYTVPPILNADTYIWTLPSGASGTSNTNSITVNFDNNAASGNITVKGHNIIGDGLASSLLINVNPLPSGTGELIGDTVVCKGQGLVTYNVSNIINATSYVWTKPLGVVGTSSTNSIQLSYGNNAYSGYLTVCGHNSCGNGGLIIDTIIVTNTQPDPSGAITGLTTVNQGQNNVLYTVPPISNSTSYIWILPNGRHDTTATNSISINFGTNINSGYLTVIGYNKCGDGVASSLYINVNSSKNLHLTAILQAYYNNSIGLMNQTQGIDWNSGNLYNNFTGTIVDTLYVLIRKTNVTDPNNPCTIDTALYGQNLNVDGTISPIIIPASITGFHYIVIKHRNSIETWSDSVDFTPNTINYNFNTHISQFALDGGMYIDASNLAYIWGGDVNQNGNLESEDATEIYVAAISEDETVNNGYVINDIDGNGNIDSQDYGLAYSNALIGANVINPFSYQKKK